MTLFTIIYFLGIASCGIQGAIKTEKQSYRTSSIMFCAGLNSFGGGLLRDLLILSVPPAVFKLESVPDVIMAMLAAQSFMFVRRDSVIREAVMRFAVIADAVGLGTFIAIGVDKAFDLGAGSFTAILCGILTSQGGGVLAAVFCGASLVEALTSNVAYHLMAVSGVLIYSWWTHSTFDRIPQQYAIILYTFFGAMGCDKMITSEIYKRLLLVIKAGFICPAFVSKYWHHILVRLYRVHVLYRISEDQTAHRQFMICCKRTLLFHCMRLM